MNELGNNIEYKMVHNKDQKDIVVRIIDKAHESDINISNEYFSIFGQLNIELKDGIWRNSEETYPENETFEMVFPDENYDFDEMSKDCTFIGAYDGDRCVGLSIMQDDMFRYMYLYDLKVDKDYRGCGIGRMLIEESEKIAKTKGYIGIRTIGQDNNLTACRFYLAIGFEVGGFNNRIYDGTSQEGKADIHFYKKLV